eukprot:TRINITY_DN5449_c0_g1_i1.p1 TRINITY_DN5449_c0_g1~~TRINITY_DN5449_c0_g1_i1.p1  ORF type:complete len:533 (-),score=41.75 TRINITY_DN5449_c0_g1_i1:43-1542(-)
MASSVIAYLLSSGSILPHRSDTDNGQTPYLRRHNATQPFPPGEICFSLPDSDATAADADTATQVLCMSPVYVRATEQDRKVLLPLSCGQNQSSLHSETDPKFLGAGTAESVPDPQAFVFPWDAPSTPSICAADWRAYEKSAGTSGEKILEIESFQKYTEEMQVLFMQANWYMPINVSMPPGTVLANGTMSTTAETLPLAEKGVPMLMAGRADGDPSDTIDSITQSSDSSGNPDVQTPPKILPFNYYIPIKLLSSSLNRIRDDLSSDERDKLFGHSKFNFAPREGYNYLDSIGGYGDTQNPAAEESLRPFVMYRGSSNSGSVGKDKYTKLRYCCSGCENLPDKIFRNNDFYSFTLELSHTYQYAGDKGSLLVWFGNSASNQFFSGEWEWLPFLGSEVHQIACDTWSEDEPLRVPELTKSGGSSTLTAISYATYGDFMSGFDLAKIANEMRLAFCRSALQAPGDDLAKKLALVHADFPEFASYCDAAVSEGSVNKIASRFV